MAQEADGRTPGDASPIDVLGPTLSAGAATPSPPRFVPGATPHQYEIVRPLGAGGMGAVFLSRDTRLGRLVAIKLLLEHSGEGAERILAEARATARLSHENIVVIHELGDHLGTPYLVLEYLKGKTLEQILDERRESLQKDRPRATETRGELASTVASAQRGDGEGQGALPDAPSAEALNGLTKERAVALMIPVIRALSCAHDGLGARVPGRSHHRALAAAGDGVTGCAARVVRSGARGAAQRDSHGRALPSGYGLFRGI